MLIASKNKKQIINADHCMAIFANTENHRVIASDPRGKNMILDSYGTEEEVLKAVEILVNRLRTAPDRAVIVYMPTDEEVETALIGQQEHYRHIDGRKTKGHGGS